MSPDPYGPILVASVAGGVTGALLMWSRKRSQTAGANKLRQVGVLVFGTGTSACALFAFRTAFGHESAIYAALVVIVVTEWVAVLASALRLPIPQALQSVFRGEFDLLRARWTGVRAFGTLLRKTPLRYLGGPVFLSELGQDPAGVLRGIYADESVHLWALLFSCPWLVVWALQARWISILCALAVHIPLNVYPTLHLRYVTFRIDRYQAKVRTGQARPLNARIA